MAHVAEADCLYGFLLLNVSNFDLDDCPICVAPVAPRIVAHRVYRRNRDLIRDLILRRSHRRCATEIPKNTTRAMPKDVIMTKSVSVGIMAVARTYQLCLDS
jgi:hypothetical protein